jgi:hypothetical protein
VQGVEHDLGGVDLVGPHLVQGHLGPLGPGVLLGAAVVVAHLQVLHGETGGVHATGRHGQHPAGRAGTEQVEQQRGEQERAHHLAGHGGLGAVGCDPPFGGERTGVVHQHVETVPPVAHLIGRGPHRVEVAHVGHHGGQLLGPGVGRQVGPHPVELGGITTEQDDVGAGCGQLP